MNMDVLRMYLIYFDLDETLIHTASGEKRLSLAQALAHYSPCLEFFGRLDYLFIYDQLHQAFFEEFFLKKPKNVKIIFATDALYTQETVFCLFKTLIPEASGLFTARNLDFLHRFSYTPYANTMQGYIDSRGSIREYNEEVQSFFHNPNYLKKIERIHLNRSRHTKNGEENLAWLIDDSRHNLRDAENYKMYTIDSSQEDYSDNLIELGDMINLDVRTRLDTKISETERRKKLLEQMANPS